MYCTTCYVLACELRFCVPAHKPVYSNCCDVTYLFALSNQVKCRPQGFCFMLRESKRSSANSIQLRLQLCREPQLNSVSTPGVKYWSEGPGHKVGMCVWDTKWLMIDSWQTRKQTNRLKDWQVDRRTTSGPLKPGHLICFFCEGYLTPKANRSDLLSNPQHHTTTPDPLTDPPPPPPAIMPPTT